MRPIFGRGEEIAARLDAFGRERRGLTKDFLFRWLPGEGVLGLAGTERLDRRARDAHAYAAHPTGAIEGDESGHSDDCEPGCRLRHLEIRAAGSLGDCRYANFGDDLSGLERGRQHVDEEILGAERTLAARARGVDLCLEGENRGGIVGRWIGVREAAADRAAVSHLHVADPRGAFREERALPPPHLRAL